MLKLTFPIALLLLSFRVDASPFQKVRQLVVGERHACVVTDDLGLYCWGAYSRTETDSPTALPANFALPIQISAGAYHTCGVFTWSQPGGHCWGHIDHDVNENDYGLHPAIFASGDNYTLAVNERGLICVGRDEEGQCHFPRDLKFPSALSAGRDHACAIEHEKIECWGNNIAHMSDAPSNLQRPTEVSAGAWHTCAIANNAVECWGESSHGATRVPQGLVHPHGISAGVDGTCVLTDSGPRCWGEALPDVPNNLGSVSQIAVGDHVACAVTDNGVRCWGDVTSGLLQIPANLGHATN